MTIELCFACNDHRNGNCRERFDNFSLSSDAVETLQLYGPETVVRYISKPGQNKVLRVGKLRVRARGFGHWVGNWCWDSAGVSHDSAVAVLKYLMARGFQCEAADVEIYEAWSRGEVLLPTVASQES